MTPQEKEPLKFLGQHLAYGVAGALTFGGLVLAIDLSHIRTLILGSASPWLVLALMFFGLVVTFGSVAMGVGIMGMARTEGQDAED